MSAASVAASAGHFVSMHTRNDKLFEAITRRVVNLVALAQIADADGDGIRTCRYHLLWQLNLLHAICL